MPSTLRVVHAASALALLLVASRGVTGCERGCLSRRLADTADADPLPLDWVDCPDGLARCVDGRLERSKLASIDPRKPGGCPWEATGSCASGCVENVEIAEGHAKQLCRDLDGGVVPNPGPPPERCPTEGPRWACVAARVVDCARAVAVATCLRGCAVEELEEDLSEDDAKVILCAR